MTDKNQISKCPCCGSMLHLDWGAPDFPGTDNAIGTCSFRPVDVRDLETAIAALTWIANNRLAGNQVRIEQLRCHARDALAKINNNKE